MNKPNYEIRLEAIYNDNYFKERLKLIDTIRRRQNRREEEIIAYEKKLLAELHPRRKSP